MDAEWADLQNPLEQFIESARQRLRRMDILLAELVQDGTDSERLGELLSMFHNMAGTAGSYSFAELSRHSREGEQLCIDYQREKRRITRDDVRVLRTLVEKLGGYLESERQQAAKSMAQLIGATAQVSVFQVHVLEWSDEVRERMVAHVQNSGLPAQGFSTEAALLQAQDNPPDALIADVSVVARNGFRLLKQLRALPHGPQMAIILIGQLGSFSEKVEAVRFGADAYFENDVNLDVVMQRLHELLQSRQPQRSSILIVDDDPAQVTLMRSILQAAGYEVHSCRDPRYFDQELTVAKPDLILMDIVMPGILGLDLVRYIRQGETHRAIPIIILSGVDNAKIRAESAVSGADLHLQKPVTPAVLLQAIAGCLANARRRGVVTPIEILTE